MQKKRNSPKILVREIVVFVTKTIGIYTCLTRMDKFLQARKFKRNFLRYGLEALVLVDDAFQHAGSRIFLDWGTLLGAYREHNFIKHDNDIDVGLLYDEIPENMESLLQKKGFKHVSCLYTTDDNRLIVDTYKYKGIIIDIFVYHNDDSGIYTYCPQPHETETDYRTTNKTNGFPVLIRCVEKIEFCRFPFLGHHFWVPAETSKWLQSIYGATFMTPIEKFHHRDMLADTTVKLYPDKTRVYVNKF